MMNILSIHCICHRLALACGDTGDELEIEDTKQQAVMMQLV